MRNSIVFAVVLLFAAGAASGQRPRRLPPLSESQIKAMDKDASDFFKAENYREALVRYDRLVKEDSLNPEYNYRLGVCYVLTEVDKKKALGYMRLVAGTEDAPKETEFFLGEALRFNNDFNDAIEAYARYREAAKGKPRPEFELDLREAWCRNAAAVMSHPVDVRFENPGKQVNSSYPDFRPVIGASDDVLYFSSNRKGNLGGIIDGFGEYLTDIYYATYNDTIWKRVKNAGTNLNSPGYNEALSLSMNGDKMLVYNEGDGAKGDIYYSQLNGKQWSKPIDMGETFETKEREEGASMQEGIRTIYFSADLNGGKGGKDIWMVHKDTADNKWGEPINLGENINTPYDDINPVLFFDGKTLFFASEGHNSMGGFDLFKSVQPDPRQGWSKAENIGYPVNTVADDKYIAVDGSGHVAYVSATREDGQGETDIYKVTFKESLVDPQPVRIRLIPLGTSGLPARDAVVIVTVKNTGELIGTFNTNAISSAVTFSLPAGEYRIKVRAPRSGRLDQDIAITGDEPGFRKELVFRLK